MVKEVGEKIMVLPRERQREMRGNKRKVIENRREKEKGECDRENDKARDRVA